MAHINYALKQNVSHVTVVSSDTDILASLLYHAVRWINNYNLKTLWNVRGTSSNRQVVPVHILLQDVGEKLALILSALHSLTGCGSISKVGTKSAALKCVHEHGYLIADFGKSELTEDIVKRAENFQIKCIKPVTSTAITFDQLRFNQYFDIKSKKVDLSHVPCTSSTLRLHIQRDYHQCRLCILVNPTQYGYVIQNEILVPNLVEQPIKPKDLPDPCKCGKCARENVCPCRKMNIECCLYCKCKNEG